VQAVGVVQGINGLATVAMSLPVGMLSDSTQRHYIARLSAALDGMAITASSAAVLISYISPYKYHLFLVAALLWGMSAACDSSLDALFADSIPTGRRAQEFTQMLALSRLCLGAGPLIAAFLFHLAGACLAGLSGGIGLFRCCLPCHR
jgi:hypothetical protein